MLTPSLGLDQSIVSPLVPSRKRTVATGILVSRRVSGRQNGGSVRQPDHRRHQVCIAPASNRTRRVAGFCVRIKRVGCYFVLFVVYQICGAPVTPDFSIALFNSGDAANALACSRLRKS